MVGNPDFKKTKNPDLYDQSTEKVIAKETDPCKMEPPTMREQQKYFEDVINNYATQNIDLVEHLKNLEDRLAVMEKTAPALMVYNLFKEIKSDTNLDFGEYVTQMVAQAELGIKPDLFNLSQGIEKKLAPTESNDSTTIAQLHQLESLLNEENQVKNRIAQMVTLESDTKAAMEILGTPEMAMAFEMQNKFDTGKFGKVNVPLTEASPTMIDKADKLCCTLKTIENCCACKLVKVQGLKSTVEYLSQVMRYAAKHEEDRDKPEIPEAKRAIHDMLLNDFENSLTEPSKSHNQTIDPPKDSHSSYKSYTSSQFKGHLPGTSHKSVPVYDAGNEKDSKLSQSYVLDHHIVHYRVDTSTINPFHQNQNLNSVFSSIHPHSIESLLVRGPKTYTNKYNQQYYDVKKDPQNYEVRNNQENYNDRKNLSKDLEENNLEDNQPQSFLVTSYNTSTLDADYILYKREELTNSIEFKPEFIKLPVQIGGGNYMNLNTSEHTATTEISSKFNILNSDDLFYSVVIPKTEPALNEEKIMMNSINQTEPFVSQSKITSKFKDDISSELTEISLKDSKTEGIQDESSSQYTDVSQHDLNSYTVGNVAIVSKNMAQYSDNDRESSIDDMQNSEFEEKSSLLNEENIMQKEHLLDQEKNVAENGSIEPGNSKVGNLGNSKKKRGKTQEKENSTAVQENLKKNAKNKKKSPKENKKPNSLESSKNTSKDSKNKLLNRNDVENKSEGNVRKNVSYSENIEDKGITSEEKENRISKDNVIIDSSEYEDIFPAGDSKESFDLNGLDNDDITFIHSIVSSFIPTSPSRRSYVPEDPDVPDLFLDVTDANNHPADIISVREENTSHTELVKHFPFANLNAIVPEITVKYYLTDKTTQEEEPKLTVEGGNNVFTKIIKPVGVDLMDTPEKFSEVIVKYNVPIPTYMLKEHVKPVYNQIEKYVSPEGVEQPENSEKPVEKDVESTTSVHEPDRRMKQLLWFEQFSEIEIPKKPMHSDSSKIHCTCSVNCDCPELNTKINKCDQINNNGSDSESKTNTEESSIQNPTNSWFEKHSSLEIAHHSFASNEVLQQGSACKNAHALKGGHSKLPPHSQQPCKVECKSFSMCPKYAYCENIACTSHFSRIVHDEKSVLPAKTPHNSYEKDFMKSLQSNPCYEEQASIIIGTDSCESTKRALPPKSTNKSYDTTKPTNCCQSHPEPKMSLKSKTTCDFKTPCECDASFLSNTSHNLAKSYLCSKSRTEVPSAICQKSNKSHFTGCCKSNLEQKIPLNTSNNMSHSTKSDPKKMNNIPSSFHKESLKGDESFNTTIKQPLTCCNQEPKMASNISHISSNTIKSTNKQSNCIGKSTVCCLSINSETKEVLHQTNTLTDSSKFPLQHYCKACNQTPEQNVTNTLSDLSKSKNTVNASLVPDQKLLDTVNKPSVCCKSYNSTVEPNEARIFSDLSRPECTAAECCTSNKQSFEVTQKNTLPLKTLSDPNTLLAHLCCKTHNEPKRSIMNTPPNSPSDQQISNSNKNYFLIKPAVITNDTQTCCGPKLSAKFKCNAAQSISLRSTADSIRSFFISNVDNILEQFNVCKCTSDNINEKRILDVLINSLHNFSKKSLNQERFITSDESQSTTIAENTSTSVQDMWDSMVNKAFSDLTTSELRLSPEEDNKINYNTVEKKLNEIVEGNETSHPEYMKIKNYMVGQVMNELNNIEKVFLMNQDGVKNIDNKEINNVNSFIQTLIGKFENVSSRLPSRVLLDDENSNYQKMDSPNTTIITERILQNKLETIPNIEKLQTDVENVSNKIEVNLDHQNSRANLQPNQNEITLEIEIKSVSQKMEEHQTNIENISIRKDSLEPSTNHKIVSNEPKCNLELETKILSTPNEKKLNLEHQTKIPIVPIKKKVISHVRKTVYQAKTVAGPSKKKVVSNEKKVVPNEKKASLGQKTQNAPKPVQKVLSLSHQTNIVTGEKILSLENQANIQIIPHENDKNYVEIIPKEKQIIVAYQTNTELTEQAKHSKKSLDVLQIIEASNTIDEGCQTNSNESLPQCKDNTTQWSHISQHNQTVITNSEIVLKIDNKSSTGTIKSHLSDTVDAFLKASSRSKNSKISNKKITQSTGNSISTINSRRQPSTAIKTQSSKISTKPNNNLVESVSTSSRPSRRITNAYNKLKINPSINRGSNAYSNEKSISENKSSKKQSKIFAIQNEVVVNQACLLTTNIASLRGASYNSLHTSAVRPTSKLGSQFLNERKEKYLIERNKQANDIFDGISQISTIRGSYQQEVTGLIDYYKRLLKDINNKELRKKIIRRSQTSLCSMCAKVSDEVSLCSCDSNCS